MNGRGTLGISGAMAMHMNWCLLCNRQMRDALCVWGGAPFCKCVSLLNVKLEKIICGSNYMSRTLKKQKDNTMVLKFHLWKSTL